MPDAVFIDGVASHADWLSDRAFQFGDGVFETVAIVDGSPCLWDAHLDRLAEGSRRLGLPQPDRATLTRECEDLCRGQRRAVLKLYWTAAPSARGYRRAQPGLGRRILQLHAWTPAAASPWHVRLCEHRLSENPVLAQIKHLNRLDQVIARAEWDDPGIAEGLMRGQDGRVVCGTMSNLFIQQGGRLATPAVDRAGIAGVVRDLVLQLAASAAEEIEVADIPVDRLHGADALYLSNSLLGMVRVGRLASTRFDPDVPEHPLMTRVRDRCHVPGGRGRRA